MAYGNQQSRPAYGSNAPKSGAPVAGKKEFKEPIYSTGLFAPTKEGVKSLGSIQVKEDTVIPAGSYINLYAVEKKNENSPAYRLSVTEGKLKAAVRS